MYYVSFGNCLALFFEPSQSRIRERSDIAAGCTARVVSTALLAQFRNLTYPVMRCGTGRRRQPYGSSTCR